MEFWKKNLYGLWFAQFTAVLGLAMVAPFLPLYLRELGITGPEAVKVWGGMVFAAPFLVSALLQPFWGILGDRYGRRPMIVRAMFGLALANLLMGFAQTAPQLLVLRLFQGSLSGFVAPSLALLASCAPHEKTGRALGTLQTALVSGMTVGPLFGGLMAHQMGYRLIFFWTGFFCLVGAIIVILFVRERFVTQPRAKGSRIIQNMRYVFQSAELRFLFLLAIMIQFSVGVIAPFLSLYVEFLKVPPDLVALVGGVVFGITGVTNAFTAPLWGKHADQVGYGKILRYCLGGVALFYLPQAFVTNAYQLVFLRGGVGLFVGGMLPVINSIVRRSTPEENRGGIYGIFQSGLLLGNVVGPLVGGVMGALLGLRAIFLITTGMFLVALLAEIRRSRRSQFQDHEGS